MIEISDRMLGICRSMKDAGASWEEIARAANVNADTIRRRLDPAWAAHRNKGVRKAAGKRREQLEAHGSAGWVRFGPLGARLSPQEALSAILSVPRDTRGFTARVMGDPLPGRSALDRYRGGETLWKNPSGLRDSAGSIDSRATTKPDFQSAAPSSLRMGSALQGGTSLSHER